MGEATAEGEQGDDREKKGGQDSLERSCALVRVCGDLQFAAGRRARRAAQGVERRWLRSERARVRGARQGWRSGPR